MSRYSEYITNLKIKYLKVSGGQKGDVLVHDGTKYVRLAVGASGKVLTASSDGLPYWA